jgi:hypothetical protein
LLWLDEPIRRQTFRSDELHSTHHAFRVNVSPDPRQRSDDLTDGAGVTGAIDDAAVLDALAVQPQKIPIFGEHDSTLRMCVSELDGVRSAQKTGVGGRDDVDPTPP